MSFTTVIKNEISKIDVTKSEMIAELSGFFRNNMTLDEQEMYLLTENPSIAKRIYNLIKECYGMTVNIETKTNTSFNKNTLYFITLEEKKEDILKDLGVVDEKNKRLLTPPSYIASSKEEVQSYLRGVFLSSGSINDPKTSRYHMELLIDYPEEAVYVQKLMNGFDLNAKLLSRDKGYMIYLKEAEKISDFLRVISASHAVLYFEDIRILREHRNMTNRLNNCEQANIDKTIETATEQLRYIDIIKDQIGLDSLDDKTKEACFYREKYKEASLQELSEIISLETGKKITKSGLNHRFRKIKELAQKIEESK